MYVSVCKSRRKIYDLAIRTRTDLLIDLEIDIAVGVNMRLETQNNASVLVGDGIENGVGGGRGRVQNIRAAGRDRHLLADLKRRFLIVEYNERGI